MGFKEVLERLREKKKERNALKERIENQVRMEEMIENKKKSANERELEKFMKQERERNIKMELDRYRKMEKDDINFGHNPLNAPNVVSHSDWEVLKERNLFSGKGTILNHGNLFENTSKKNRMRFI